MSPSKRVPEPAATTTMARDTARGYLAPVIHPSRLLDAGTDRICFDTRRDRVVDDLPPGPAVMSVVAVTDALKVVSEGFVVDSVDRESVARVTAFAVERTVLERIGDGALSPEELIEAVRAQGVDWVIVDRV